MLVLAQLFKSLYTAGIQLAPSTTFDWISILFVCLGWIGENIIGTFTFSVRAWYSQVRYFNPLIIIQATELILLWYDLCLMWYRKVTKKIQA